MNKRILTAVLVVILILPFVSASAEEIVTVTYPNGTVVEMTVETYLTLFIDQEPSSVETAGDPEPPDEVPWPVTDGLKRYPLVPKLSRSQKAYASVDPNTITALAMINPVDCVGQVTYQNPVTGEWVTREITDSELWVADPEAWDTYAKAGKDFIEVDLNIPDVEYTVTEPIDRVMAYLGPSRNYVETDSYRPNGFSRIEGLFIEGNYVYVDMNYPSVGVRRTYFTRGTFESTGEMPEYDLIGYPGTATRSAAARYGPSVTYDIFPEASVGPNTPLTVYYEETGFIYAEYQTNQGLVRAWLPAFIVVPE